MFNIPIDIHDLKCPITRQIFCDPVLAEDGRIYEKRSLETWFKNSHTSPMTGMRIETKIYPMILFKNQSKITRISMGIINVPFSK